MLTGERVPESLHVESLDDDFRQKTDDSLIKPHYFGASFQNDALVLTPLASAYQFRPSFGEKVINKKDWKPVKTVYGNDAKDLSAELLSPNFMEASDPKPQHKYLEKVAPLCTETLENDFSTCSL